MNTQQANNIKKFIEALRNPSNTQIIGRLYSGPGDNFCALGLAIETANPGYYTEERFHELSQTWWKDTYDGLDDNDLIYYNDDERLSFSRIAELVEEWLNSESIVDDE